MEAGRQLDTLVAEKVMGWKDIVGDDGNKLGLHGGRLYPDNVARERIPSYSTDIAAAWQVVEQFSYFYLFYWEGKFEWECKLFRGDAPTPYERLDWYARGKTAPLAICRASLRAVALREQI